jgi:putative flippase GtrA
LIREFTGRILGNRLVRFFIVGGINSVFGYGLFALFIRLGLHPSLALLLATVLGVAFNFGTIGKLVFKTLELRLIMKFVMVYTVLYLVNWLFLKLLLMAGYSAYVGGAVLVVPMGVLGFVLHRTFVFTGKKGEELERHA